VLSLSTSHRRELQSHITDSPRLCAQIQFSRARHFPLKSARKFTLSLCSSSKKREKISLVSHFSAQFLAAIFSVLALPLDNFSWLRVFNFALTARPIYFKVLA
jgi:hypothetical protein